MELYRAIVKMGQDGKPDNIKVHLRAKCFVEAMWDLSDCSTLASAG